MTHVAIVPSTLPSSSILIRTLSDHSARQLFRICIAPCSSSHFRHVTRSLLSTLRLATPCTQGSNALDLAAAALSASPAGSMPVIPLAMGCYSAYGCSTVRYGAVLASDMSNIDHNTVSALASTPQHCPLSHATRPRFPLLPRLPALARVLSPPSLCIATPDRRWIDTFPFAVKPFCPSHPKTISPGSSVAPVTSADIKNASHRCSS